MPDGFESDGTTPKFTKVTSTADISYTPTWGEGYKCLLAAYVNEAGNIYGIGMCRGDLQFSGETAPTATIGGTTWYDTSANKIKVWRDDAWKYDVTTEHRCLFLGIVTVGTGNVITSIDQIFNGAGYIGHHSFVLPGVKGLAPNGIKDDGTVSSVAVETMEVQINDLTVSLDTFNGYLLIRPEGTVQLAAYIEYNTHSELTTQEKIIQYIYDTNLDYVYDTTTGAYDTYPRLPFIKVSVVNSAVTVFNTNEPLRIANIYDVNKKLTTLQDTKLDVSRIQYVSAVPGNPQDGVIYLIAQ